MVNGQWLKGSGGAAVWAAITPADVANIPYGTSLPASPFDGQEAILVDSVSNPTYQWRFRYNAGSTSTYKWEFVGGSPVILGKVNPNVLIDTSPAVGATAYHYPTGWAFTVPRAGDWDVWGGFDFTNTADGNNYYQQAGAFADTAMVGPVYGCYFTLAVAATVAVSVPPNTMTAVVSGKLVGIAANTNDNVGGSNKVKFDGGSVYVLPRRVS